MKQFFAAAMISLLASVANADAVFELRTYTAHDGKLEALQARFRNHTMALFEKHGMVNVGYWLPADTDNTLIYLLRHNSDQAAKASWQGFINDPEWQQVYQDSRANGPLIINIDNVFVRATDYSQMK